MAFYGVKIGRKPGVYPTWDECFEQTNGFSGAKYKKFNHEDDAHRFVFGDDSAVSCKKTHKNPSKPFNKKNNNNIATTVHLYTDGACSGNPGNGGYGYAVVIDDTVTLTGSGGLLSTTNNQMELTAVIEGLKEIPNQYSVVVVSDSSYVVNAFEKDWITGWKKCNWRKSDGQPVANRELWEELLILIDCHFSVSFTWVRGHNGNKHNELCDRLAVKAIHNLKD